ncbi:MAG: exodeoxyribonuclease VII small subunit [Thermoplasmata archaeon]|jgi:exodeoxyribonuclease VII small subunit|nr:exodeoxyribonuclease VII small subunit [Thermoplasmata archaeon]
MTDYSEEVEKMTFEEAIAVLENLVKDLEAGGIDLDKSIEIYEKAVILRNHCRKILDESERRIQKIMESEGQIKTEDFDVN